MLTIVPGDGSGHEGGKDSSHREVGAEKRAFAQRDPSHVAYVYGVLAERPEPAAA